MLDYLKSTALAASAVVALAAGASAATISTGSKAVDITCTGSCEFWDLGLTPDGFNASSGDWVSATYLGVGNNNSNSTRLTAVNNALGSSYTGQSESSDNSFGAPPISGYSGGDNAGWSGSSEYYLAWGGPDPRYILIKNNTAGNSFTWTATGQGSGLSGVDGFGTLSQVPLPAAGWMLLAGVGGLAAVRRRKKL